MKKQLLFIFGFMALGINAQSLTGSENYIYSKTNLTADGTKKAETVTYYDGLGRPKQTIAIKASPTGKDLVTPILYDAFGRQAVDVLPFPMTTQSGGYQGTLSQTAADAFYGDKAYAEKVFENSPLDRVLEQKQTGNNWNGHSVHFAYEANDANEVIKYTTTTTWNSGATVSQLVKTGYYPAATLYRTKVTDEDDNISYEFKNGRRQTLLVRKFESSNTPIDTYYIYNEYDQLAFVISPLAADKFKSLADFAKADTDADIKNLCYVYRYDGKGRLVEKKLPGKDWEYLVYDQMDRLVATQDGNLRAQGQWMFNKYDAQGRMLYTGLTNGETRTGEQRLVDTKGANFESRTTAPSTTVNGMALYYTNGNAYPGNIIQLLTVNYYDSTAPYAGQPAPANSFGKTLLTATPTTIGNGSVSTKGLPVLSLTKNIEDDNWTWTYSWYDEKGRVVETYEKNHLGGFTRVESNLNFSGLADATKTTHSRASQTTEITINETFTYDNQNRIVKQTHQVNGGAIETLAENTYNEIGQLTQKKVGNNLQTITYQYNVKGWLTQINNPGNLGSSLFGLTLRYENPVNTATAPKRYNGNISESEWNTAYTGSDGFVKRYGYQYDGLNRLTKAKFVAPNQGWDSFYDENLIYDLNGNITGLERFSKPQSDISIAERIDNLSYTYTGNQVTKIADTANNPSGYPYMATPNTITYDANGNMLKMPDKGISSIAYNFLNLPKQIIQTAGNTTYVYSAAGLKVKKVFGGTTTDYLDGFQYTNTVLQFVPTVEGYYDFTHSRYVYQYKDQVGNVRLSYYKNGTAPKVDKESNYYPFGVEHTGYNSITSSQQNYQYTFQGQEKQDYTNWLSFKWRNYDPSIGRFFNVDPLSEKYAYQSHYNFSENRVIDAVELEGLEAWFVNGKQRTTPMSGWRTDARTIGFGLRYPSTAIKIGSYKYGSANISTSAGNFAYKFAMATDRNLDIGSNSNAVRHALWSALIRSEFDAGVSKRATNAHEGVGIFENQNVDISKPFTGTNNIGDNRNLADHIVDILNNKIGMNIAQANPDVGNKGLVSIVLERFKNNGLWTFTTDKDGNISIGKTKLGQEQYDSAVKVLNSLNENGYTADEQNKFNAKAKEELQRLDRGPKF